MCHLENWRQMDNTAFTARIRTIAISALAIAMLSGCGTTTDWIKGKVKTESDDTSILGAPEIDVYIEELALLASNDPAATAEIYADATAAATLTPGASTSLRLGLVLAIPGHAESDPERAQILLRDSLSQELLLTPAEIALARIHLNNVERQLVTQSETDRLRLSSSRMQQTQDDAATQRLANVEAENRRLRRELAEAEDKLEAITSIERSIREQE